MKTSIQDLSTEDIARIERLLRDVAMSWPATIADQKQAKEYADTFVEILFERNRIEHKREKISEYFHQSIAHPAIRQMSADRINQTYDRLVEQGKIKEGEN